MDNNRITNKQVVDAGLVWNGHYNRGYINILFDNLSIKIPLYKMNEVDMFELFDVFNIDCENGRFIHELRGKYCRVGLDNEDYPTRLIHIVKDIEFNLDFLELGNK